MSRFGPAVLKVERTEKEWPIEPHIAFFMRQFYIQDIVETSLFVSLFSKFYGAEYLEDNT